MVSAGDFKNGITIEIEGNIYQIMEFQHVKPGKGAAFVRTKLKNIISGGVVEKTFRPTEKFENAHIERKDMQYLYSDGELYHFMDVETFDQIAVDGLGVAVYALLQSTVSFFPFNLSNSPMIMPPIQIRNCMLFNPKLHIIALLIVIYSFACFFFFQLLQYLIAHHKKNNHQT